MTTGLVVAALLPFLPARAGEGKQAASLSASNAVVQVGSNPENLKKQVRVTLDTNAPPAEVAASKKTTPKNFDWEASWKGWDGLHLGVTRKTLLGQQVNDLTNVYSLNLEETRMAGKIGAKFALDAAAFVANDDFDSFNAGAELRRARIYARGDCLIILPVSYQFELGYIPGQFYIEESYLAFKNLPWIGELKGGQYQAPMGLDAITSSRDITFMEPSAAIQALAPGVNAGLQIGRPVFNQRATWKLGVFTDGVGSDFGDASEDYGRAIIRFTGLPLYRVNPEVPDSTRLLHLGLSANILYSDSSVRYQSRPESHLAPHVIDTGDIAADGALVLGAEAAWVNGPFSVQGELLHSSVRANDGQVPSFIGFYGSASWFLTGESRPYDRTEGMFARVIPKRNFRFGHGSWGAWEIAARYSYVDLDSGAVHGGRLSLLMAGVNWYLHSNVKWRFDYGLGHVSGRSPDGNLNVFQTRMELDF